MRHPLYLNLNMIEPKYTPQLGAAAIRLLGEGKSFSAVGRALGVHRDTIKNWGKRYDPELGKAVVEAKQRWGREKSMNETLEYLEQNPLQKPDMEEPLPPSPEELDREKWRRIFQDVEEKFHKRRLEEERALAEKEDIPGRWIGFGLGKELRGLRTSSHGCVWFKNIRFDVRWVRFPKHIPLFSTVSQ